MNKAKGTIEWRREKGGRYVAKVTGLDGRRCCREMLGEDGKPLFVDVIRDKLAAQEHAHRVSNDIRAIKDAALTEPRLIGQNVLDFLTSLTADPEWVSIRNNGYPWRQIVAAAKRGECEVSQVGRQYMMHRNELAKFLRARRVPRSEVHLQTPQPKGR